ncbi:MAG TPA: putative metallopeptidase [Geobacteraceae bacterium]
MNVLDLTAELERLITAVVVQVPEFSHIDPARLLVCVAATRNGGVHGTYARIHPLRFAGGARTSRMRRGRSAVHCTMPTITHKGTEILYLIYFITPRFFNLSPRQKLITVFHELYHISPAFDGDIRRFPGKNYAHGSSRKRFDALMAALVDAYLEKPDRDEQFPFLEETLGELRARYRVIVARRLRTPRIEIAAG